MFNLKNLKQQKKYLFILIAAILLMSCNKSPADETDIYYNEEQQPVYQYDNTLYEKYKNVGFKIPAGEYNTYKDGKKWKQWHFDNNNKDGNYINFLEMMGLGFEYFVISTESEVKERALFHMGSPDDETYATIEKISEEKFVIKFDNGDVEELEKTDDEPFNFGRQ